MSDLPVLVIVIPLAGGFLISLTDAVKPSFKAPVALLTACAHSAAMLTAAVRGVAGPPLFYAVGGWVPPVGIGLVVDSFSAVFLIILAVGHPAAVLFRMGSENPSEWTGKSATLIALFFASLSGITVTADLFNLFVFVELATVCSIGLIARKRRPESSVAGFVYLMVAALSGGLLLFSVLVIYITTGTVSMHLAATVVPDMPRNLHAVVTGAVVISFGIKFGLVPLHIWQPRAYHAAGTTAAAILSAFGMKIYLYALVRLLWLPLQTPLVLPELYDLLLAAAIVNILTGHLMALIEHNLIRMLAFSSIAHVGYVLLGVAAAGRSADGGASVAALTAALFHMGTHAFMKSALLWGGHRFVQLSRSSRIADHSGVARAAPGSTVAFFLAAPAIVGIPPTGGFASKWFVALVQQQFLPVLVIGIGTVISLYYYSRFFLVVTRSPLPDSGKSASAFVFRPRLETALVLTLAVTVVLAGIGEAPIRSVLTTAAEGLINPAEIGELAFPGGDR